MLPLEVTNNYRTQVGAAYENVMSSNYYIIAGKAVEKILRGYVTRW